jgi:HSP20 family protein
MPILDMIPWKRQEAGDQEEDRALQTKEGSFLTFQQEMNQLFERFFRGSGLEPFGVFREGWAAFYPRVDAIETDKAIRLSIELPGLEEEDIDVSLTHDVLTVSGEKRQAQEQRGRGFFQSVRSYGSFRRSIPLPGTVDADNVEAVLEKGVLMVTLPKAGEVQARQTVPIKMK